MHVAKWAKEEKRWDFSPIFFGTDSERNSFSLRSTEIGLLESVELRFKVYLLDKGYALVPTTRSFTEDFGFGGENLVREALPSL